MNTKAVAVTGATSYPGVHLVRALAERGSDVHAIVRPESDTGRLQQLPASPTLHVHDGSTDGLSAILGAIQPQVVHHLAAHYVREHTPADVELMIHANVLFCAQLAEAMRLAGTTALVYAGSHFEHFDADGYRPLNLYAATKWACSNLLEYYRDAGHFAVVTLVLFDVYGPDDWRDRLFGAIARALASGEPWPLAPGDPVLDLVYIDDAVAAFLRAGELLTEDPAAMSGRRFAVRGLGPYRLSEVVAACEAHGGKPIPVAPDAYPVPLRTVTRPWAGPLLPEWEPRVGLDEGVARVLGREGAG